jgi:hypothetical protein
MKKNGIEPVSVSSLFAVDRKRSHGWTRGSTTVHPWVAAFRRPPGKAGPVTRRLRTRRDPARPRNNKRKKSKAELLEAIDLLKRVEVLVPMLSKKGKLLPSASGKGTARYCADTVAPQRRLSPRPAPAGFPGWARPETNIRIMGCGSFLLGSRPEIRTHLDAVFQGVAAQDQKKSQKEDSNLCSHPGTYLPDGDCEIKIAILLR